MKLAHAVLLAGLWLASIGNASAAFVCAGSCEYGGSVITSTDIHALSGGSITDVLGEPDYTPLGVRLSTTSGSAPTPSSTITIQMTSAIAGSLWVIGDDDETASGFTASERFQVEVSLNGGSYTSLGTFFNDNAEIDLSSFGIVNYVRISALDVDVLCQISGTCPAWDNAMEVLGVAGLTNASAVPVPAAAWLFGSGLVGLAGMARRRQTS